MECLKCVLRGAEIIAGYDKQDREALIKELETEERSQLDTVETLTSERDFLNDALSESSRLGEQTIELEGKIEENIRNKATAFNRIREIKVEIEELRKIIREGGKPTKLIRALQELETYLGTVVKEVNITDEVAKELVSSFLFHANAHMETDMIVDLSKNSLSSHALSTISGYFQGLAAAEIMNKKFEQSRIDMFYNTAELSAESEMIPPLQILNYLAQAGLRPIFVGELFGMHISSDVRKVVGVWADTNQSKAPVSPDQILSLYLKPRPFTLLNILPISLESFHVQGKSGKTI